MMSKLKLNNYIIVVGSNKDIYYKKAHLLFIKCNLDCISLILVF